jgi:hypothetical protein
MSQNPAIPPMQPVAQATRIQPLRYKAGHPRLNVAILLVIIAVLLAFALVQAQRMTLG